MPLDEEIEVLLEAILTSPPPIGSKDSAQSETAPSKQHAAMSRHSTFSFIDLRKLMKR